MDLRVLCVFVVVAYVDVSARITCIFYPKSWESAMQHCLSLGGTPVSIRSVRSLTGLHLNGSFWTADYASITKTAGPSVECEYLTKGTGNQLSQAMSGNCDEIRKYICGDHTMTGPIVRNGTWQEATRCNETSPVSPEQLPVGDYWLRTAYQHYVFTGDSQKSIARCGVLDVNGKFQFVINCKTLRYLFCEIGNYTESDLSVCGSTVTTNQPSSNQTSTFISQTTEALTTPIMPLNEITTTESTVPNNSSSSSETLTATSMSINENTSTESTVRNHASSSLDFKIGTTVQQTTKTLTTTIMSINENTTTESIIRSHVSSTSDFNSRTTVQQKTATSVSIHEDTWTTYKVRNHASSSPASALGIGLGVSLSIVVIVIITMVGVCVHKRRKANCVRSREECGRTEFGDKHVYDEISNSEELAYAASMVDIYDKIRTDGEKEHAYESVTSQPKH